MAKNHSVHMTEETSKQLSDIASTRRANKKFDCTKQLVIADLVAKAHRKECK